MVGPGGKKPKVLEVGLACSSFCATPAAPHMPCTLKSLPPWASLLLLLQVRRMFVLLPEALGRDQPGCLALVLQHFEESGAIEWNFEALTQVRDREPASACSLAGV